MVPFSRVRDEQAPICLKEPKQQLGFLTFLTRKKAGWRYRRRPFSVWNWCIWTKARPMMRSHLWICLFQCGFYVKNVILNPLNHQVTTGFYIFQYKGDMVKTPSWSCALLHGPHYPVNVLVSLPLYRWEAESQRMSFPRETQLGTELGFRSRFPDSCWRGPLWALRVRGSPDSTPWGSLCAWAVQGQDYQYSIV